MEKTIIYNDTPYDGVWNGKTTLIQQGIIPNPFTTVDRGGIFYDSRTKKWNISLKWGVSPGEIIIIGDLCLEYRIIKGGRFSKKGYRGFAIERLDGCLFTSLDLDNAKPGAKVRIRNRKTAREIFKIIDEL